MIERDKVKKKLIEQLNKVNMRLGTLDMIEEKLLNMKKLARRVVDEDLADKEIEKKAQSQAISLGYQVLSQTKA